VARILVAEDEPGVRSFVVRALQIARHEVTAVEDGQQALERLVATEFDLLVTDIVMPHVDGIALALKATRDWPRMAVLLMTGYPAERQRAFNLDALIDRVILKPFTLDEFLAAIGAALERRAG
jgi:DNA-binding response OmpR family regulator